MTDRPTIQRRFEQAAGPLIEAVSDGSTLTDACATLGVPVNTARNWVSAGRREPEGPYGTFVSSLDDARARAAEFDTEDREIGRVERAVEALIGSRDLTGDGRVLAAQARALAHQVDALSASRGGQAGLALASVSRRLQECVDRLGNEPKDLLTELQERRAERRARLFGIQPTGGPA